MSNEIEILRQAVANLPDEEKKRCLSALSSLEKSQRRLSFQQTRLNDEKQVLSNLLSRTSTDLEQALENAYAANRAKSAFLANMSHELRTPLNAVIGYTDLVLQQVYGTLNEKQNDRLVRVMNNARHLLDLINDILDLSKIESGKMELAIEVIQLQPFMEDMIQAARPLADKNQNQLVITLDDNLGQMVCDSVRLKQILLNLLSNACKFTEKGTVTLLVQRPTPEWLSFEVKDTGIGMSDDQIAHIFEEFVQGDQSTTRLYGGTGLGLAITRRLCELMGGSISVTSVPQQGSTFCVKLPERLKR